MTDLNNLNKIKELDPQHVYESTGMLVKQCEQIWEDAKSVKVSFNNINAVVFAGMGGSSYGAHIIESCFSENVKVPVVVVNDYHLPGFVDSNTLVVLTSYSGTTEETITCYNEAKKRNAKLLVLTSGGNLEKLVNEHNLQALIFNPTNNPCKQPRLGTGYIIMGTIALLNKIGLISITDNEFKNAMVLLDSIQEKIIMDAKKLALELENKIPLIIASDFLKGNAHILRNQMNETAKSFANYSRLPELNHHLMEGLKYPNDNKLAALFITSDLYSERIQQRVELTKTVISKNNIKVFEYKAIGSSRFEQMLSVLSFGGYLSIFLALIYDENPSLIPWVDYFKEQLKNKPLD